MKVSPIRLRRKADFYFTAYEKAPLCGRCAASPGAWLRVSGDWGIVFALLYITTPPSATLTPPLTQGRLGVKISPLPGEALFGKFDVSPLTRVEALVWRTTNSRQRS